ncbi:MAG: hypothetical protein SFY32_02110 [Bacteroidota bacterium]|nr:hypothetical protein [Bacteroidota bacterium]
MHNNFIKLIVVVLLTPFLSNAQSPIKSSPDLIAAMHKKYNGNFNANITFIQINTYFLENGKTHGDISYEAFHFPGKFRVDHGVKHSQDGFIVLNDSVYNFKGGVLVNKTPDIYDLLMLTGDIYFLDPKESVKKIKKLGYNLDKFHEDVWNGKPVYVAGADKGDEKSPQFWIDKDELYLIRNINVNKETGKLEDAHFKEHTKVQKAWVEERVEIFVDGKMIKKEHYAEVKADNNLDMKIFDHNYLGKVHWRK